MLTVDFERLGLKPGDRTLDMGAGAGRHAVDVIVNGRAMRAGVFDVVQGSA